MPAPRFVLYCEKCGNPPEYCIYGPSFKTHCAPWLIEKHPSEAERLYGATVQAPGTKEALGEDTGAARAPAAPAGAGGGVALEPWTPSQRLSAFYAQYEPGKLPSVPSLLSKYAGREEALFTALQRKYGPEPIDPYLSAKYGITDDSGTDDESDLKPPSTLASQMSSLQVAQSLALQKVLEAAAPPDSKARGTAAKKVESVSTKVVVSVNRRQKKKFQTQVHGIDTVPGLKLKDAAQAFRKRFAGSSSVKEEGGRKVVIIQGDHKEEVRGGDFRSWGGRRPLAAEEREEGKGRRGGGGSFRRTRAWAHMERPT